MGYVGGAMAGLLELARLLLLLLTVESVAGSSSPGERFRRQPGTAAWNTKKNNSIVKGRKGRGEMNHHAALAPLVVTHKSPFWRLQVFLVSFAVRSRQATA